MTAPDAPVVTGDDGQAELPILIGASATAPEALLLVGRPDDNGTVLVRRWSGDDWSAMPAVTSERTDALLRWVESQAAAGRSLNQSVYGVQRWLGGAHAR